MELKPCPFCGNRAMKVVITPYAEYAETTKMAYGRCTMCGARGPLFSAYYRYGDDGIKSMAIELWNRRADDGQTT